MRVNTYGEEKERRRKYMAEFPMGGVDDTNPEKMEDLYESVLLWGTEEDDGIYFPDWKEFNEY